MRMATLVLLAFTAFATTAFAQVFDLPADGAWRNVQTGDVTQWSAIPTSQPHTRIDLLSYTDHGVRTTYYLVRSACANGEVAAYTLKPDNRLGIGVDCAGNLIEGDSSILNRTQKLPAAAAALLRP